MKKNLFAVLVVLLVVTMVSTTVSAGGNIKLSSAFSLRSLFADVTATGLSSTDYTFELAASGVASVVCTNYGGNQAPGQNSPHVDGTDLANVGKADITKNGKATFSLEAVPPEELNPYISWDAGGCPNSNWTAMIDFVYWQSATITAYNKLTQAFVKQFTYQCVTTRTGPNSTPSTFDDGTVSCTRVN